MSKVIFHFQFQLAIGINLQDLGEIRGGGHEVALANSESCQYEQI